MDIILTGGRAGAVGGDVKITPVPVSALLKVRWARYTSHDLDVNGHNIHVLHLLRPITVSAYQLKHLCGCPCSLLKVHVYPISHGKGVKLHIKQGSYQLSHHYKW